MPKRILVVAEAPADQRLACGLVDRKILHHAPAWFDRERLEQERRWLGLRPGQTFTPWTDVRSIATEAYGLRRLGPIGFRGETRRYDYAATRKVLLLCARMTPRPDAVLLVRDLDRQAAERRASIEAARNEVAAGTMSIVLALPDAKREAWVLNGFECCNAAERKSLTRLRKELGFDPCLEAERLNHSSRGAARDAKRVLALLSAEEHEREERCWSETAWPVLRTRGAATGLASFLEEVARLLVPLFANDRE